MNRCVYMFYIPYFSLHHQYKLSEFLGFCKTPKNVGYIFRASGGSLNTCRLLHKMVKILFENLDTTWPHAGKGICPKDKLVFFSSPAPISSLWRGKRLCNDKEVFAGFVMIRKLFKLSYLTARAPAKSHVQFRLCLRNNKQYNGSHVQFHDCQVSSSITQRHSMFYFNVRTD